MVGVELECGALMGHHGGGGCRMDRHGGGGARMGRHSWGGLEWFVMEGV